MGFGLRVEGLGFRISGFGFRVWSSPKTLRGCAGGPRSRQTVFCRDRKVDVRLPGKGDSNSHGARPVHLIISMIKWIRASRLSIKNFLSSAERTPGPSCPRTVLERGHAGLVINKLSQDIRERLLEARHVIDAGMAPSGERVLY